jgi:hypothetical protein
MDASMFIWASIARCGKAGEMVKCEIGVASAITAVNSMVNVILKAIDNCDVLTSINKDCALAASEMTKNLGGLAAGSGGLVQKCFVGPKHADNWNPAHRDPAMCAVDVKNGAKNLFKVVKSFLKLDDNCNSGDQKACAANGLQIAGALAGIGSFLAGAIGNCHAVSGGRSLQAAGGVGEKGGEYPAIFCAEQAQKLVKDFSQFAARALEASEKCEPTTPPPPPPAAPAAPPPAPVDEHVLETSRLYSKQGMKKQFTAGSTNLILAAFVPVTAIVGFVGGKIFGSRRATRSTREYALAAGPAPALE